MKLPVLDRAAKSIKSNAPMPRKFSINEERKLVFNTDKT